MIEQMTAKFGKEKVDLAFEGKASGIEFSICYVPEINEYNGSRSIQMKIQGFLF